MLTPSTWIPRILGEGPLVGGDHPEDADGSGDGARIGPDLIRRGADPEAARGGDAAHRGDDRFAVGAGLLALAADDLGGKGAAAAGVDAEDDGLDVVVVARLADERRGRVAADLAGRLGAVEDRAAGHDDPDPVALGLAAEPVVVHRLQIVGEGDLVVGVGVFVLTDELDEVLPHLDPGQGLVGEAEVEGGLGGVAVGLVHQTREFVGVLVESLGRRAPRRGDILEVDPPEIAEPLLVGLLRVFRHVVAEVGLDRRLVGSDLEDVDIETELVDALLVVHPVAAEALEDDGAHLVGDDLVGVGREVVGVLAVLIGDGDDLLAAGFEVDDRLTHVLELGQPSAAEGRRG